MWSLASTPESDSGSLCGGARQSQHSVEVCEVAPARRSPNTQCVEVEDQKLMATLKTTKTKQHLKKNQQEI